MYGISGRLLKRCPSLCVEICWDWEIETTLYYSNGLHVYNCAVQDHTNTVSGSCQLTDIFFHDCVIHQLKDEPWAGSYKSCMNLSVSCPFKFESIISHQAPVKACWSNISLQRHSTGKTMLTSDTTENISPQCNNYLVKRTKNKIKCNVKVTRSGKGQIGPTFSFHSNDDPIVIGILAAVI